MPNYYTVLGVDEEASQKEIKMAFTDLAKDKHPDHNDHPKATQQFQQIKEAYDVLRDPERRAQYDGSGHGLGSSHTESVQEEPPQNYSWTDHTRGSPEADYIWKEDTERVAEKAPTRSTEDRNILQRVVAYSVAAGLPFVVGIIIAQSLIPYTGQFGVSLTMESAALFVGLLVTVIISIYAAETILNTHRRMPSP